MPSTPVFHLEGLPRNSNLINCSLLTEFWSAVPFRSFSIKYVAGGGCETYVVNGKAFPITAGQYLLANQHSEGYVEIDSKTKVTGICIDIAPNILSEVVASWQRPDTPIADVALDIFFDTPNFLENSYQSSQTHVGKVLQQLDAHSLNQAYQNKEITQDFYFYLAEQVVADHIPLYRQLQHIQTVKPQTRKDLYRRIAQSREYIAQCFATIQSIAEIATEVGMSEYHFFRTFKAVYGLPPHQYLLQTKLQQAHYLLCQRQYAIAEVALLTGFADIAALSKAFKKYFGYVPSAVSK